MGRAGFSRIGRLGRDEDGNVLVESSVIMPMFLLLSLGLVSLGFLAHSYIALNFATTQAARQLALDSPAPSVNCTNGLCSLSTTPYTDVGNALRSNSGLLGSLNSNNASTTGGITISRVCVYPAGSTCSSTYQCTTDATCVSKLGSAVTANVNSGAQYIASLTTTYPCFIAFPMFGFSGCTLTANASFQIQ